MFLRFSQNCTIAFLALFFVSTALAAVKVEDGSESAIGKADARVVLDLIEERFADLEPKVSVLRRADGSWICGSVNVKNRDGLYSGERGFVVDLSNRFFGRVPDGPEMLSSRSAGFEERERVRQLYFGKCLD